MYSYVIDFGLEVLSKYFGAYVSDMWILGPSPSFMLGTQSSL